MSNTAININLSANLKEKMFSLYFLWILYKLTDFIFAIGIILSWFCISTQIYEKINFQSCHNERLLGLWLLILNERNRFTKSGYKVLKSVVFLNKKQYDTFLTQQLKRMLQIDIPLWIFLNFIYKAVYSVIVWTWQFFLWTINENPNLSTGLEDWVVATQLFSCNMLQILYISLIFYVCFIKTESS